MDAEKKLGSMVREGDMAVIRIPMKDVHSLRVALAPCPCRATKSTSTSDIRERFSKGLARLESKKR